MEDIHITGQSLVITAAGSRSLALILTGNGELVLRNSKQGCQW